MIKRIGNTDYYHYIVAPVDCFFGLHPLSAILNREGIFKSVDAAFLENVQSLVEELCQKVEGPLRHEPYVGFEAAPLEQSLVSKVYFKLEENGTTQIFSRKPDPDLELLQVG